MLKGKTVLITGAASGLGRALAIRLAKEKVNFILIARKAEDLKKVKKECSKYGVKISTMGCDLSEIKECKNLAKAAIKVFGKIDIVINNAGYFQDGDLEVLKDEEIDELLDVNLRAPMIICREIVPSMKKRKSGVIVNIISTSAIHVRPEQTVYGAAKAGLLYFGNALRDSLRPFRIKVINVLPGGMKTNLFKNSNLPHPTDTFIEPSEVADLIVRAIDTSGASEVGELIINRMS